MLTVGSRTRNARSGTEFEVLELGERRLVMRQTMPGPTRADDFVPHFHVGWDEAFDVLEGRGAYLLRGKTYPIAAGETVTFPERVPHRQPVNREPAPLVVDQRVDVTGELPPDALASTVGFFFTMYDWEAQGRIALSAYGLPRNPLQFALAARTLARGGSYDARFPKLAADLLGATMGRLARLLGHEVIDPKWRTERTDA